MRRICLKDIPVNSINLIIKCNIGERIYMLELEKNIVFLPQKYLRMTVDHISVKAIFIFKNFNNEILIILHNLICMKFK